MTLFLHNTKDLYSIVVLSSNHRFSLLGHEGIDDGGQSSQVTVGDRQCVILIDGEVNFEVS